MCVSSLFDTRTEYNCEENDVEEHHQNVAKNTKMRRFDDDDDDDDDDEILLRHITNVSIAQIWRCCEYYYY